tara:strand:+ start:1146 stop:1574 length:429 start_codon:yes stop_codon:yes gene_type:complete
MKLILGSDHAGFNHKEQLIKTIKEKKIDFVDLGTKGPDSVDYPDYAHLVSKETLKDKSNIGILICGSANGVAMAANKHKGIRAAICWNVDIATLAVTHNNSNILCLPARFISKEDQKLIFEAFIKSSFEGGRHKIRVDKINC